MTFWVVAVPFIGAFLAYIVSWDNLRRAILVVTAAIHSALTIMLWTYGATPKPEDMLGLDAMGMFFLTLTSALFFLASFYAVGYLIKENKNVRKDMQEEVFFRNTSEKVFTMCLMLFLGAMTLVTASQHLGMLWIGTEATTLFSAPLIYFHRHHRSLEAMWKYLLICSVGIALALLGTFALAAAAQHGADVRTLNLPELLANAKAFNHDWLKMAFIFLFVGYGTKTGLAPFHMWLPDAHGESPSVVSALLSGVLLNCAFLGILRAYQVLMAAGMGEFGQGILITFGLLSMAFAAIFIINQDDFKRMLAYSSVEHMGILSLAVGIGGAGTFGAALHALNHSFVKGMLFMVGGNLLAVYKSKCTYAIRGAIQTVPVSGVLWLAGFLAITGSPPFGMFLSEFTILKAALDGGHTVTAVIYLSLLAVIFIGMAQIFLRMSQGTTTAPKKDVHESWLSIAPPIILLLVSLALGIYIPAGLKETLDNVAMALGGGL